LDSELPSIVKTVARAVHIRLLDQRARQRPADPARILVAPHLRLGDAILITPLLAKLRAQYPEAEIVLLSTLPMLPLYQTRPYGVVVWPFHPRRFETVAAMMRQSGFDLAILPGDNRHGWLAAALRSKWIVAHAGDTPRIKNWPIDELIEYPTTPNAIGEIFAGLVSGPDPIPYAVGDWPQPPYAKFPLPERPYAVLHVGASTGLKLWPPQNWRGLALWLEAQGFEIVWSCGPGENALLSAIEQKERWKRFAGSLDLAQMWHLISQASVFVAPDTGVAHLARLTGTPAITLFGPGTPTLFGRGKFWARTPCAEVTLAAMPCRNQDDVFQRHRSWIRRCRRSPRQCRHDARCMKGIEVATVKAAIEDLLNPASP
jgi:ADP-heptose:LPS heptosyltransferase